MKSDIENVTENSAKSRNIAVKSAEGEKGPLRVLELFAGIGGMHRACQLLQRVTGDEIEVAAAVDVNTTANTIYRYNHPDTVHWQRNITGITDKQINKLRPDVLLMSPPCQPHTRLGKRKDTQDPRSDALKHILELLPRLPSLRYILLENVQGFESSESREQVITVLRECGFDVEEFLINPVDLGIPNSRLRYYLIAKKGDAWTNRQESLQQDFKILEGSVRCVDPFIKRRGSIQNFLQQEGIDDEYLLSEKALVKYGRILDIVNGTSTRSCCFTKAYGHYYERTGSVLQQSGDLDAAYREAQEAEVDGGVESVARCLGSLGLRFFTPTEISRLLGFPAEFGFPSETARKQRYRTLGNSLSVHVVTILLHHLIYADKK